MPDPQQAEHVYLKVVSQGGAVAHFKLKKCATLRKLMTTFCDRAGLNIRNIRFRFDGQPIMETDTPASLNMDDGDTIDAFEQLTGGHC